MPTYGKRTAPSSRSHRHTEPIKQAPSDEAEAAVASKRPSVTTLAAMDDILRTIDGLYNSPAWGDDMGGAKRSLLNVRRQVYDRRAAEGERQGASNPNLHVAEDGDGDEDGAGPVAVDAVAVSVADAVNAAIWAVMRNLGWDPERDDPADIDLYERVMAEARHRWPWLDEKADEYVAEVNAAGAPEETP